MKTVMNIIFLIILYTISVNGQLKKIEKPNTYYEADIYIDEQGERYSTIITVKFNKKLIESYKGIEEVDINTMVNCSTKDLLKSIEKRYGKFKLEKVFPNTIWGDRQRVNKRTGKLVTISERSQIFRIRFENIQPIDGIIKTLQKNENVEYVEGPAIFTLTISPNDYFYVNGYQWEMDATDAAKAWDITRGLDNIYISINDLYGWDDVNRFHDELTDKFVYPYSTTAFGWHGTKVAGVVAALTDNGIGVASLGWNTRLMGHRMSSEANIDDAVLRGGE